MKLHDLNRPKGSNRYCGPAVLSFVTGIDTNTAAAVLRDVLGRRAIRGASILEVIEGFRNLGIDSRQHAVSRPSPTLAAWLKGTHSERTSGRVFLVLAGNHWQLITGRRYACGAIGDIVPVTHEKVKRRARVFGVWELFEMPDRAQRQQEMLDRIAANAARQATERRAKGSDKAYVKRVAAQHGISVEVDDWGGGSLSIYCFPPDWFQKLREEGGIEGFYGDSDEVVGYSWAEARDVLDRQIAAMQAIRKAA